MRLRSSESALRHVQDAPHPGVRPQMADSDGNQTAWIADASSKAELDPHLVVALAPQDPLAQAARNVRAMISAARLEDGSRPKVIVLLGADADPETALLSANVAIASAQSGWRTLLVDSDAGNLVQHRLFGLGYVPGKSHQGADPLLVVRASPITGLALASAEYNRSTPAQAQMHAALRQVSDDFDLLIVDASHRSGADAATFGADAAIVVLRRDYTAVTDTQEIVHSLRTAGTEVLGTFMFK